MVRRAPATSRDEIVARMASNPATLRSLGVASLALFGSAARGEITTRSDVDVLVGFHGRATFDRYTDLKTYLERLLGRRVDLVTTKALKPAIRERIAAEAVHVA
jgi:predicted nucleotidyltransferase